VHVKSHHPLKELLAQLLFGIETVPKKSNDEWLIVLVEKQ
jgi:hypothetical protein